MQASEEELPATARLILIAANPRAGARCSQAALEDLTKALGRRGFEARVITDLERLTAVAAAAASDGQLRAVVAAGGDGTLAELVNRTSPQTPLAVFPLGTANLLANFLCLRPDPDEFAEMLAAGCVLRWDAAQAKFGAVRSENPPEGRSPATSPQPGNCQRIFLIVAGVGFDAAVVERLHAERTGHIRMWNYAKPIVESLRSYTYPELRCECALAAQDGTEVETTSVFSARWLFVQNLPCYAGGLQFAPAADPQDGLLDVCALAGGSLWRGLKYLGFIWAGQQRQLADYRLLRVKRLRITCQSWAPVQFDGDPGGAAPLEIEALPGRIRLVAPPATIQRLQSLRQQAAD